MYLGNGLRINNPERWTRRRILRRSPGSILRPNRHVLASQLKRLTKEGWFTKVREGKSFRFIRTDKPWEDKVKDHGTFDFERHRRLFVEKH